MRVILWTTQNVKDANWWIGRRCEKNTTIQWTTKTCDIATLSTKNVTQNKRNRFIIHFRIVVIIRCASVDKCFIWFAKLELWNVLVLRLKVWWNNERKWNNNGAAKNVSEYQCRRRNKMNRTKSNHFFRYARLVATVKEMMKYFTLGARNNRPPFGYDRIFKIRPRYEYF